MEVQQLQKDRREPSFCGPEPEEAAGLDCISVSQENMEELRHSGRTKLPQLCVSVPETGDVCC